MTPLPDKQISDDCCDILMDVARDLMREGRVDDAQWFVDVAEGWTKRCQEESRKSRKRWTDELGVQVLRDD